MRRHTALNKHDKIVKAYEDKYPFMWSIIISFFYILFLKKCSPSQIDDILDAIINYTAILLGFTGVFVSILFTLTNTRLVKTIFESLKYKRRFQKFFIRNFQSGFCLILVSVLLYARVDIKKWCILFLSMQFAEIILHTLKAGWIFLVSFFSLSSYRLISLMIRVLFGTVNGEDDSNSDTNNEDNRINELRRKYDIRNK